MFLTPRLPSPLAGLKELPARLVLAKWGLNESVNGNFTVNATSRKFLPVLQRLLGRDTIPLDFEHNTIPGTEAYKAEKEPRNVAAHAALSVVEGEGIVAHDIQWTPHGEKSVREGLHPDLSPTIKTTDLGEVVFVHSAALCRAGAAMDLKLFSAADLLSPEQLRLFSATLGQLSTHPPTQPPVHMDYKKLLIILLGLAPNASDADIEAACRDYNENMGALKTHAATLKGLQDSLAALATRLEKSDREALVREALAAGKLIPHGAEIDKLPIEAFRAVLDSLPAGIVPLAQRTPEGLKTHVASLTSGSGSSAADAEVARQMGNSDEALKKYGDKTRA
ncbi:MAG: hypothetical protein FJ399_04775 [Verrucomicrobia bacterium]|nr:hypothetical protein [Verrucomicrobiota bacterium]